MWKTSTTLFSLILIGSNAHAEMETIPSNFYTSEPSLQWPSSYRTAYDTPRAPENVSAPSSTTVTVVFPKSGSFFRPSLENAALLSEAQDAALIMIRGRSSTLYPSKRDEALCLARAASARQYLIEHGVSPLKIAINYASASDFVATNDTPEGRLRNQRVEIELIFVNGVGLGNGS